MTIPSALSPAPLATGTTWRPLLPLLPPRTARLAVLAAVGLALAADLLLYDGPFGIAFPIWVSLTGLVGVALMTRAGHVVSRGALAWLGVSALFAFGDAWRGSEPLRVLDTLVAIAALGMAAMALSAPRSGLFAPRLRDTVGAALHVLRNIAAGPVSLVFRELPARGARGARGARAGLAGVVARVIRPTALAAVTLIVFGSLLRGADPIFASFVAFPDLDAGAIVSHLLFVGVVAWIVAGWARGALTPSPGSAPRTAAITLSLVDTTAILGVLIALFALFVAAQVGWFFGGEGFLRARTGLTAASYARRGFFQTVWVVALVIPVLLGTRWLSGPGDAPTRRHTMLSLPIVALLLVTIASAALRLELYVRFYGLTTERFYPIAFLGWLVVVLAWMCITVLRGRPRSFAAGALISGLATLAALNVIDPDRLVARVDIARAEQTGAIPATATAARLDLAHLATLSGDAAPLAVRAIIDAPRNADGRCAAARTLLKRWGAGARVRALDDRPGAWRQWNAGDRSGQRAVLSYDGALRAVTHDSCGEGSRKGEAGRGN